MTFEQEKIVKEVLEPYGYQVETHLSGSLMFFIDFVGERKKHIWLGYDYAIDKIIINVGEQRRISFLEFILEVNDITLLVKALRLRGVPVD